MSIKPNISPPKSIMLRENPNTDIDVCKMPRGDPTNFWSSDIVTNHPDRKHPDFSRQFPTVQYRNRFCRRYPVLFWSQNSFFGATTDIDVCKMPRGVRQMFGQATSLRTTPIESIPIFPDNSRPSYSSADCECACS